MIATAIPFVGCASDGQIGPQAAPSGPPEAVQMTAADAAQLAYYVMQNGPGVIGPRGWSCAGIYGSDGATLVVAPNPLQPSDLAGTSWSGATGDAIEARVASGDTSGRFTVAQVIMRVFPAHQAFAQGVINEGIEPASSFPARPYASDKITTKSNEVVEFQTPSNAVGLGTDTNTLNLRMAPGADPVSGVVILSGQAPDLSEAVVRLPANLRPLAGDIIQRYEADNPPTSSAAPAAANSAPPHPAAGNGAAQAAVQLMPGANPNALAVVEDFYQALGQGNGAQASVDVVPEKRSGNYAAAALTRYYGSMTQPLQLVSATAAGNTVAVRYTFTDANGRACNGAANVTTTSRGGVQLISTIQALNGC
ncbi:MAG TPA: hypothetical protein VN805_03205 [Caulobacteraceae bacterium]|nr:hypothetical protein [Caulobacteraceae bacterium]